MSKLAAPFNSKLGNLKYVFITGDGRKQPNASDGTPKPNKFEASAIYPDDAPEIKEMEKEIKAYWKDNKPPKKPMKSNGISREYTRDEEGEKVYTGYTLVQFKTLTQFPKKDGKPGNKKKVIVYNASGNEVNLKDKMIGEGSVGIIIGAMDIYNSDTGAGVTLYLNAVQLKKFVEYKGSVKPVEMEVDDDDFDGSELNEHGVTPMEDEEPENVAKLDLSD